MHKKQDIMIYLVPENINHYDFLFIHVSSNFKKSIRLTEKERGHQEQTFLLCRNFNQLRNKGRTICAEQLPVYNNSTTSVTLGHVQWKALMQALKKQK